jgi:D-alanyl-D-alanine dipeptidase
MSQTKSDEQARRRYWTSTFDEAWEFMNGLYRVPLEECGEEMVSLEASARDARLEVTFSTRPHAEGSGRKFFLRRGLIGRFLDVARAMNDRGWALHVEDAYRTTAMQRGLWLVPSTFQTVLKRVRWELGSSAPDEQLFFRRLASLVAACPRIGGHLAGAAIDVGVFRRASEKGPRGGKRGEELDRGGAYLDLSEITPMASPFLSPEARANRQAITEVFQRAGLAAYPYEFWHYSLGDVQEALIHRTGRPARYGPVNFDPASGKVTPVPDAEKPFVSMDEIRELITV